MAWTIMYGKLSFFYLSELILSDLLVSLVTHIDSPVLGPRAAAATAVGAAALPQGHSGCQGQEPGTNLMAVQGETLRIQASFSFWPNSDPDAAK